LKCPFCGNYIENTLYLALAPYRERSAAVITNIDYIVEVGNRIVCIIEEKHSSKKRIRGYQLVTLKKVAKALNVPLLLLFVDDVEDEVTVYNVPVNMKFPRLHFYNFEKEEPIFVGGYRELRRFILKNFVYAPPSRGIRFRRW